MIIRHLRWSGLNAGFTTNGVMRAFIQRPSYGNTSKWILYDPNNNKVSEHHSIDVLKERADYLFEIGHLKPKAEDYCPECGELL
jgi:hypothetical protein